MVGEPRARSWDAGIFANAYATYQFFTQIMRSSGDCIFSALLRGPFYTAQISEEGLTAFVGAKKVYFLPSSLLLNRSSNAGSGLSRLVPIPAMTAFNVESSGSAAIALSRVRADVQLIKLSKCAKYNRQSAISSYFCVVSVSKDDCEGVPLPV